MSRRAFAGLVLGGLAGATLVARRLLRDPDYEEGPNGESLLHDGQPLPPYRAPEFAAGRPALAFLALGDTGWPGPILDGVVAEMERNARALPFSFVCLLGDNFYPDGVSSLEDPRLVQDFERTFVGEHLGVPFHVALGNHDHNGIAQAQVEYSARSPRWRMPSPYRSFVEPAGAGTTAEFFVLDTEEIRRLERAGDEQLRWFEERLASSQASWKIVLGHHPVRSNGEHGGIPRIERTIESLLERYDVALYLSGHDHDLELLETGKGYLQVVSGAGSSTRSMGWGDDSLFASVAPGYVWVGIDRDELWLVFIEAGRGPVYSRRFARSEFGERGPARVQAAESLR